MRRFEVVIFGKDLGPAQDALHDVGIETATGPDRLLGWLGEVLRLGSRMTMRLDADTAQEAEDRVRDALPDDRGYRVEQAKPLS
jgi:hypothetical protein